MSYRGVASLCGIGCVILSPLVAGCGTSSGGTPDAAVDTSPPPKDAKSHDVAHEHAPDGPPSNYVKITAVVPTREGSILSDDHQIYCGYGGSCEGYYAPGSVVTFTEVRAIEYLFKGWGGACAAAGTNTTCMFSVSGPATVSVDYEVPPLIPLTVMVTGGTGDMVTSNPTGISTGGTQTSSFPEGTGMTLTAIPGTSQGFAKWVGGQCGMPATQAMSTCKFGLGGPDTETATFMPTTCPFIFAHDGTSFAYETSVGGASLVGRRAHLEAGKDLDFAPMWARLDHVAVDYNRAGAVRTKVIAAEDEIVYFDDANLAVLEHPVGYEVLSSSSIEWPTLGKKDPQTFFALESSKLRTPHYATWMGKEDVTAALSVKDDVAARNDKRVGNYYDLDFGAAPSAATSRWLLIDGWKYKEARELSAAKGEHPRLDVKQPDGSFRKAMDLATPRGDRKTVAFDISAVTFPTGRYEMRIVAGTHEAGNAMWYLDRVRVTEQAALPLLPTELPAKSATLSFTGVPSSDANDTWHPVRPTDDGKGELGDEYRTYGHFTRYGDVKELLGAADDRMVVMRRGDGVELEFVGVPKAAPGNEITVMLKSDLLFKPRRFLGDAPAELEEVEPLPYHGMQHYPPPAPFPSDKAHAAWRAKYETRVYEHGDTRWGK